MNRKKYNIEIRIMKALNLCFMAVPFALCWYGFYAGRTWVPFFAKGNWLVILLFVVIYGVFGQLYDGFQISLNQIPDMICSQGIALFISEGIMYIIIWLLTRHLPNPLPLFGTFVCQLLLALLWAVISHRWYFTTFPPRKTAVIFDQRVGLEKLIGEYGLEKKFCILKTLNINECLSSIETLKDMETVFLSGIHSHERNIILKYCVENGIDVFVIPRIGDVIMSGARHRHMFHLPILQVGRYRPTLEYLFIKRFVDIIFSISGLILFSPILLLTAIAIKITDHGPIFYKQCRLTENGKQFDVIKFRSMCVDAEKNGIARLSTGDADDRITPIGKIIRKVRIDELPQLINILKGDMTLVGPRPERPEIARQYEEELPEFRLRLQVKAGLTGYAQVYGKYNTIPYDKLQMDLMYIANANIIEDLKILFETVRVILFTSEKSTEGIAAGATTAQQEKKLESIE